MDGARMSGSVNIVDKLQRREISSKRHRGDVNTVDKLQRREISSKRHRAFSTSDAHQRFRNIRLKEEYDFLDSTVESPIPRNPCKITEIVAIGGIVFAVSQSGLAAAISRETNERICFLNVRSDEIIRNLFYNKNDDSLITVSLYSFGTLMKCRTTGIEYLQRGMPDAGVSLFESEPMKWPCFVKFDGLNGKILAFSGLDGVWKVFDLKNYTKLYTIPDKNVKEIKIGLGILLLIFTVGIDDVPLKILSIEDVTVLKSFNHEIHPIKKVDFIELFTEKILFKQQEKNLQILDLLNFDLKEVRGTDRMYPSEFVCLHEKRLFLTFINRKVAVWNYRGFVSWFEDHLMRRLDFDRRCNDSYITSDQNLLISYCKADSNDSFSQGNAGSINISNILTGKSVAKLTVSNTSRWADCCCGANCGGRSCKPRKHVRATAIRSTVKEALDDITAIFYDEKRNEIYTGNSHGLLHVWSN